MRCGELLLLSRSVASSGRDPRGFEATFSNTKSTVAVYREGVPVSEVDALDVGYTALLKASR